MGPRLPPAPSIHETGGAFSLPTGGGDAEWGRYESGIEKLLGDAMHSIGIKFRSGYWIDLPTERRTPDELAYPWRRARADFAVLGPNLVVEADGLAYHSSPDQVKRDRIRTVLLERVGWSVIRFNQ